MDSFEWNKIAGAVLATVMFVLVVKFASDAIFEAPAPAKPGYVVEGVTEEASNSAAPAAPVEEALPDFGTVLPAADAAAGQKVSARCEQCHDLSKGGPNKIGPNLWGVIGRARATHPGFAYSSGMSADHGPWTFDKIFRFLKSPQAYVPGTKMSFAGITSANDRINLIAWLRTQSDSPAAIPAPAPAKPAAAPAPAAPNAPANSTPPGAAPKTPAAATPKKS
ncbi:MAG TPA: cytochrome c family protein [Rhizomicrobium sp.]|nr:cytochrome c family protein [Rhizomicrobium sp.]